MDIQKIIEFINNPRPYDKGTAVMWTDEHISKQLLALHLNSDIDVASRNEKSIEKTTQWLLKQLGKDSAKILDLGCGPGLYTEKLALAGHMVTGIDFSENSIAYAKQSAKEKNLSIPYVCQNYLDIDEEDTYDLIMMIYCDFGVLTVEERRVLLSKVFRALKKGGLFIFDALNINVLDNLKFEKSWDLSQKGFWRDIPYMCLSESFHFPEQKATLDQHIVIEEDSGYDVYRFWNHYFVGDDMKVIMKKAGFASVDSFKNLIEGKTAYNDKDITFYKATK